MLFGKLLRGLSAVCLALGLPPATFAAPPAEEFRAVMRTLADAVAAGRAATAGGAADFTAREFQSVDNQPGNEFSFADVSAGTVGWGERGSRWDYEKLRVNPADPTVVFGEGFDVRGQIAASRESVPWRYVLTPSRRIDFRGRPSIALVRPARKSGDAPLEVRPSDCWYAFVGGGDDEPFDELFDRLWLNEKPGAAFDVTTDGSVLTVTADVLQDRKYAYRLNVTADLAGVPQVRSFRLAAGADDEELMAYSAVWTTNAAGDPYPARIEHRWRMEEVGGATADERMLVTLSDYRRGKAPAARELTVAGLDMPAGTRLVRKDGRGTVVGEEWVGGSPPPAEGDLDALAEELKAGAFAGGDG